MGLESDLGTQQTPCERREGKREKERGREERREGEGGREGGRERSRVGMNKRDEGET